MSTCVGPGASCGGQESDSAARALLKDVSERLSELNRIVLHLEGLLGTCPVAPAPQPRGGAPARSRDGMARVLREARLTQREQDVVELLARGLSNRRIACDLKISEPTVKNHLRAAFLKLDVTDRTQAVVKILHA
ncbi:response regulator transcription factor [Streptomyces sp. NPDC053474]|uniref:response regulator transcription factor n=1 Tax=Streptomyces sp. NPDC053474 TaxID=3365704 RepID=UPI0037D8FC20